MRRDARFIDGAQGKLFVVEYLPERSDERHHAVIIVPPFAEEMNRSRRMVSLLAELLANARYRVVVADLYGTGDSEGDFGDSRWDIWREDIALVEEYCRVGGATGLSLLALRTGALLAFDYAKNALTTPERIVLWQPCSDGDRFLRQFLRIRLAAALAKPQLQRETMDGLLGQLARGQKIEVAGYELSPDMAAVLSSLKIESLATRNTPTVDWLDIIPSADADPPVASGRVAAKWRERGVHVHTHTIPGEPFWSLQETTLVPDLLDATAKIFTREM